MRSSRLRWTPRRSWDQIACLVAATIAVSLMPLAAYSAPASAAPGTAIPTCMSTLGHLPLAPVWHTRPDTPQVTQKDLAAVPAADTTPRIVKARVTPQLPITVMTPVFFHVIRGRRRRERTKLGPRRARALLTILNNGMAGKQSSLSTPARFRFYLKKIDYTRNESWYLLNPNTAADRHMRNKLHRGNVRSLNVYINSAGGKASPVLGWSRFPWQYASAPRLDGIDVNVAALPGGSAKGYNLGDTLIHETGHWLGLLHPFQGGCEGGDLINDTPAEAEPSFYCETTRDTCEDPGLDPVHNFMDYSLDSCMNMFTADQVRRMDTVYATYRLGK